MGRLPLPVGTYGKISSKKDGSSWEAWCKYRDIDGVVRPVRCLG